MTGISLKKTENSQDKYKLVDDFWMILNVMNQLDICNAGEWLLKVLEYGPMTVITSLEKVLDD